MICTSHTLLRIICAGPSGSALHCDSCCCWAFSARWLCTAVPQPFMAASLQLIAVQDDVLMYGGRGGEETRPQFVLTDWHVASEFMKDFNGFVSTVDCLCVPTLLHCCWGVEMQSTSCLVCIMLPHNTHSC